MVIARVICFVVFVVESFILHVRQRNLLLFTSDKNPLLLPSDNGMLYDCRPTRESFLIADRQRNPFLFTSDK
eukprot:11314112-Heterocapsa_arctica.AAC.1